MAAAAARRSRRAAADGRTPPPSCSESSSLGPPHPGRQTPLLLLPLRHSGRRRCGFSSRSSSSTTTSPPTSERDPSSELTPPGTPPSSELSPRSQPPERRRSSWWWDPYAKLARLDKPIGTWLLFWPCAWGVAVGLDPVAVAAATNVTAVAGVASIAPVAPTGLLLSQFGLGSILLRGAGCTINDLWDQDIDKNVARTSTRPLASGDLTSHQALQFLLVQLALGACVLVSMPHLLYTAQWSIASLPLVAVYPTTKRYFPVPQLVLGLAMNWGAWVGYASMRGCMDYSTVLPLYASGVTWTLLYDTIYAHQDKDDDAKLGLHSSALTFGSNTQRQTMILTGLATLTYGQWLYVAVLGDPTLNLSDQSIPFWVSSVGGMSVAYGHLLWQVHTLDYASPQSCLERFQSNRYTGGMVFGSLLATKLCSNGGSVGDSLNVVVSAAAAV